MWRTSKKMATWLSKNMSKETVIISNTAIRAKQTMQALSNDCIFIESLAPNTSLEAVLKTLNDLSKNHQENLDVVITGHQP